MKDILILQKNKRRAARYFNRAAATWIRANSHGKDDPYYQNLLKECDRLQGKGAEIVGGDFPGVGVSWPGLYPSFTFNGRQYISVENLYQWGHSDNK